MSDYYDTDDDWGPLFDRTTEAVPSSAPPPELTNACAKQILARLEEGPASCREIDRMTEARGQAIVGDLRKRGYSITTEVIEDTRCYRLRGFVGRNKVSKSMQERYYQTKHWRETAQARKELDRYMCKQCGKTVDLQCHHWVYNLFEENVVTELITLCEGCHTSVHQWIKGGGCHFPDYVTDEVARRLSDDEPN